jgi:hypothetical protein
MVSPAATPLILPLFCSKGGELRHLHGLNNRTGGVALGHTHPRDKVSGIRIAYRPNVHRKMIRWLSLISTCRKPSRPSSGTLSAGQSTRRFRASARRRIAATKPLPQSFCLPESDSPATEALSKAIFSGRPTVHWCLCELFAGPAAVSKMNVAARSLYVEWLTLGIWTTGEYYAQRCSLTHFLDSWAISCSRSEPREPAARTSRTVRVSWGTRRPPPGFRLTGIPNT